MIGGTRLGLWFRGERGGLVFDLGWDGMDGRSKEVVYCLAKDSNTIVAEISLYTHMCHQ